MSDYYEIKIGDLNDQIKELEYELNEKYKMQNCKNCKNFNKGYCEIIEQDDNDYKHNNKYKAGIEVEALDDSGLDVKLRVSENFVCGLFAAQIMTTINTAPARRWFTLENKK